MHAITYEEYGSPDVLQLTVVDQPVPKDNEVLIRIRAAVVSTTDCTARSGKPYFSRLAFGIRRPKHAILGTEFAGVIEAIGRDVTRLNKDDEVFAASGNAFGAHAEYICLPEDAAIAGKPSNASFEEAAAISGGMLTALPFLRDHGKVQPGHTVLINGASGAVGTAAVQLAKHFEAHVTGVCSTANMDLVRSLGADQVIDYTREDFTQARETYDIVFDAAGKSSFQRCQNALKAGGIYMTTVPSLPIFPQMLWTSKFGSKRALVTFTGLRPPAERARDLDFIRDLVESERVGPAISQRYPLEEIPEAHRYVESGRKTGSVIATMA